MAKIEVGAVREFSGSGYPAPFRDPVRGRHSKALGDAGGLTQFGVKLVRLEPGAASSQRHWHEAEDEFVYMLDGELVLVESNGETRMVPGDAAAFPAGVANGHHLVNRTDRDATFLVVGTRASRERCHYPDLDLMFVADDVGERYTNRSGDAY
ncbi:MAG TPA: cupin domain-containing protein [Aestuariivirgaceae bacterium]|nr:cupin domain-containing protein [Aestuariivirgaceae bacterium]